jgi:hypothetical protein
MLHSLSMEGFPRTHNLPQDGFGIPPWSLLWVPSDDISDMKRTLGKVTKTPNVWTRWKCVCQLMKADQCETSEQMLTLMCV